MEHSHASRREHYPRPPLIDDREKLIVLGIDKALHDHRQIDDMTARLISLYLATSAESALTKFAYTGKGCNHQLRAEYLPIYHHEDTSPEVRELIDWFGSRAIASETSGASRHRQPLGPPKLRNLLWRTQVEIAGQPQTLHIRADKPNQILDGLPESIAPLLHDKGDPFRSFLELSDVDATADDLLESFEGTFRGTFSTERQVLDELTDAQQIRSIIDRLQEDYHGGSYVEFNEADLFTDLHEGWDIVRRGDVLHVFDK